MKIDEVLCVNQRQIILDATIETCYFLPGSLKDLSVTDTVAKACKTDC